MTGDDQIMHAIKACWLALQSACLDCAGDITVEWRPRTAEWVVTVDHSPACPFINGITNERTHP